MKLSEIVTLKGSIWPQQKTFNKKFTKIKIKNIYILGLLDSKLNMTLNAVRHWTDCMSVSHNEMCRLLQLRRISSLSLSSFILMPQNDQSTAVYSALYLMNCLIVRLLSVLSALLLSDLWQDHHQQSAKRSTAQGSQPAS